MIDEQGQIQLRGVHPKLVQCVLRAAETCPIDITLIDGGGLRTQAQANGNAARGTGIKNSMHLMQPDGYGHAVDALVLASSGSPAWDVKKAKIITDHILSAGDELLFPLQVGADWDMDGVYYEREKGKTPEDDCHHVQIPRPEKLQAATAAMNRRIAERLNGGPVAPRPTLRLGDHGVSVRTLQRVLGGLTVDGDFGPKTEDTVKKFQRETGLVDDGVVGAKTWGKLA